ncbi:MAG: hypothetical protein IPL50_18300 [Chitinophagaceae bacterium]|nr:hypothetical protein [Chitinophagaceae bacterium]
MTTNIFITKWFHVFTHPFFLIRHGINNKIEVLAETISGKVLDFGCGAKPYSKYFIHAKEYIGLDIEKSGHSHEDEKIDVYYDGKRSHLIMTNLMLYFHQRYLNIYLTWKRYCLK